jgi:hypothetical protein
MQFLAVAIVWLAQMIRMFYLNSQMKTNQKLFEQRKTS